MLKLSTPADIKTQALLNVLVDDGTNDPLIYISSLDQTDQAPSASASPLYTLTGNNDSIIAGQALVYTNTSSQIRARATSTPDQLRVALIGWKDTRGQ